MQSTRVFTGNRTMAVSSAGSSNQCGAEAGARSSSARAAQHAQRLPGMQALRLRAGFLLMLLLALPGCFKAYQDDDDDGIIADVDCNDMDNAVGGPDQDQDGHPCDALAKAGAKGDCDDHDPDTYPGALERCDGRDNSCNGLLLSDDGNDTASVETGEQRIPVYADEDGDTFGGEVSIEVYACAVPDGFSLQSGDCDDSDADVKDVPRNEYPDLDHDGHGDAAENSPSLCAGSGAASNDDCDDRNSESYPGADELCDGLDNDCDQDKDEGVTFTVYLDQDEDGFGSEEDQGQEACTLEPSFAFTSDDCDDSAESINPDAEEIKCDQNDDDCDDAVDEGTQTTYYQDQDGDGHGNLAITTLDCELPSGFSTTSADCNDYASSIHPDQVETCNNTDDDCDQETDEGVQHSYYADSDRDRYGAASTHMSACVAPSGYVSNSDDCDDTDAYIHPDAIELPGSASDADCSGMSGDSLATFAGGFTGDGGPLAEGQVGYAYALATSESRIYLNSAYDNRIRRIGSDLTLSTVAGSGVAGTPKKTTVPGETGDFADDGPLAANLTMNLHTPSRASGIAQFELVKNQILTESFVYFTDLSGLWRVDALDSSETAMKQILASDGTHYYGTLSALVKESAPVLYLLQYNSAAADGPRSLKRLTWDTHDAVTVDTVVVDTDVENIGDVWSMATSTRGIDSEYVWFGKPIGSDGNTQPLQRIKMNGNLDVVVDTIDWPGRSTLKGSVLALCVKEELDGSLVYMIIRESDNFSYLVKLKIGMEPTSVTVLKSLELPSYSDPMAIAIGPSEGTFGGKYQVIFGGKDRSFYGLNYDDELDTLPGLSQAQLKAPGRPANSTVLDKPYGVDVLSGQLYVAESMGGGIDQFTLDTAERASYRDLNANLWDISAVQWNDEVHKGKLSLFVVDYEGNRLYDANDLSLLITGYGQTSVFAWINDTGTPSLLFSAQANQCIYQAYYDGAKFVVVPYAGSCGDPGTVLPTEGPISTVEVRDAWDITASLIPAGKGYRLDRVFYSSSGSVYQIADNYVTKLQTYGISKAGPWIEYAQTLDSAGLQEVLYVASDSGYVQRLELQSNTTATLAGVGPESPDYPSLGDIESASGPSRMGALRNLAFDPDTGILYVADEGASKIRQIQAQ